MSWIAIAVTTAVVSASVSAYGSYQQGQAQKRMNQYNSDVANQQALIQARTADTNVQLVQSEAANQSKIQARKVMQLEGEQKGVLAAQGVGGGSVTSADIEKSTLDTAELDKQAIKYNADTKSWAIKSGSDFESWNLANQSNQYTMAGKNAAMAGDIGVGTSLLQGASQIASAGMMNKYYQSNKGQTVT